MHRALHPCQPRDKHLLPSMWALPAWDDQVSGPLRVWEGLTCPGERMSAWAVR